eukprot:CAMPEP_0176345450 /NCGR_PEP_ID=MMETSP0126-20121128/5461_1 /TAXON_ID=141414 ORGANISM="Strombidinopsis acuminatum, Strain SPMC142" /NCGR_SAMPLE_ID=MMETSP0126 /ASSEMBLY_ACC=CAM_ASM_000229 /LENGTH=35 /DNA_ID= /DNA_START= /DNA_END= /DNA_ORIENTATION=
MASEDEVEPTKPTEVKKNSKMFKKPMIITKKKKDP